MKKLIISLSAIFLSATIHAQDKDLVNINYDMSKPKYNDTSANTEQLKVNLRLPLLHSEKNTLIGGIEFNNVRLHNFPDSFSTNVSGISGQLIWITKLSYNKILTLFSGFGIYSDMKNVRSNDWRYSFGASYGIKYSDKFKIGWGLNYAKQFFGNQIVPFASIDYQPNDKWNITGLFPVKTKAMYHLSKKTNIGIELSGGASSYGINNDADYVQIKKWTTSMRFEYKFAKSWLFYATAGANVRQDYSLYNNSSSSSWTIITTHIGTKRDSPVEEINNRGLDFQLGVSFNPLDK